VNIKKKIGLNEAIMKGKLLSDVTVIDVHVHLGRFPDFYIPADVNITNLICDMDRVGVDKCFISGLAALGPDFALGNEEVAQAVNEFPDRIYGLITFNPHYPKEMK